MTPTPPQAGSTSRQPAAPPASSTTGGSDYCCGATLVFVAILVVAGIIGTAAAAEKTCDLCGNRLLKTHGIWQLNGKKTRVCAECNRRLREKVSRDAFDKLGL